MAALTGNKIKDSYLGLLKSISNGAISSSFVQISDGGGNALPLYLSTSSIKFYNAYTFPSADGTISGQVLSTDASGTLSWVTSSDNQTLEEVLTQGNTTTIAISSSADITTTAQFNGDINGALLQKVIAAEVLSKGDVVYISGGTGANPEVSKANASDSTKMPALGIMKENLNNINDEGECITSGELTGVDLTGIATGAELFVSSATAGELVTTAPTGEANLIQKIGKVIKGDSSGGALTVLGAFRTNAVPNLNSAKIFLGNASNQAVSTAISGDATISDTGVISLATVPVTKGGTGATTLTGILLGNGTSAISGITSAVDGNVLTADGNGGYAFEGLPVKKTGTITVDELAVFDNADGTLRSDSTISIDSSGNITFDQGTNNYLIGGGNIAGNVGSGNVGLGHNVLTSQTSGNNNIAIGFGVLDAFVTGASNIALGDNSMGASTGGTRNIAIGKNALQNGAGSYNLAIGDSSMSSGNLSGLQNTCVGYTSGNSLTSGGNNLFIGNGAGSSVTTVSNNVILGSNNGSAITDNNNIIISDGGGNNRIQVDSGGNTTFSSSVTSGGTITNQISSGDAIVYAKNGTVTTMMIANSTAENIGIAGTESAHDYVIRTSNTEKMRISSGGDVTLKGNGTTSALLFDQTSYARIINKVNQTLYVDSDVHEFRTSGGVGKLTISSGGDVELSKSLTVQNGSDPIVTVSDTDSNYRGSMRWLSSSNVLEFFTRYAGTYYTNNLVLDRGNVGIGTTSPVNLSSQTSLTIQGTSISRLDLKGASGAGGGVIFGFASGFTVQGNYGVPLTLDAGTGANMLFNIGGSNKLTISSGGDVGIGFSGYGSYRVVIRGASSTSSDYAFRTENAGTIGMLQNRNDGLFQTGDAPQSPYYRTTANSANTHVASNGALERSTASSKRFKDNITEWNESGLNTILALKPKTFTYKKEHYFKPDRQFLGLIAEEVADVSGYLADYENEDGSGQIENVRYANIVVPLIKAIQEQQTIIEDLKSRIETLEG